MIHLAALPGTPGSHLTINEIVTRACHEAEILVGEGVDALVIENMHDVPYLRAGVGPEIVAAMTRAAAAIRSMTAIPVGVQVLAAANDSALAVALAANLDFIRAEGFVFAHVADEGIIEGCAGTLLRKRKAWGAESVRVFVDIKKKHSSHAITGDVDLVATAEAAEFFGADGLIVTGTATGRAADPEEIACAARATALPVIVGSGVTIKNVARVFKDADAVIVGSHLKEAGDWRRPVDRWRVREFLAVSRG